MLSDSDCVQEISRKLQSLAPDDKYTQWLLAEERRAREDFAGAAEIYRKILQSNQRDPDTARRLAEAEIRDGQKSGNQQTIQDGIRKLEAAVRSDPTSAIGYFSLGWAYHAVPKIRDLDKAKSFYQEGLEYNPRQLTVLNLSLIHI